MTKRVWHQLAVATGNAAGVALGAAISIADISYAQADPGLQPAASTSLTFNGVTTSASGRIFLPVQRQEVGQGPELVEIVDGEPKPYPDAAWNSWRPGTDARHAFVGVNAIRVVPDGALWVVDKGAAKMGADTLPGGPKLVRIDLGSNAVSKIYTLAAVAAGKSYIDDVRFKGPIAYLTDAGRPGLIVLDLKTGKGRRVLDDDPSTKSSRPLKAEGRNIIDEHKKPVAIEADQLELSPDGQWLYYQPCAGPMSRIETRFLDDPSLSNAEVAKHVEPFADTHSTGGTAIDAKGNIYSSDTDNDAVLKIAPSGQMTTLIKDPRLVWVDAMWIDDRGRLWLPATQQDRTKGFNGGKDDVHYPTMIYTLDIGAEPVKR